MPADRFDRQVDLFGAQGQERLRATHAAIVGVGGVGSFVAQGLALLGVGAITLIDADELAETNRNRHVCARKSDPIPGTLKANITARSIWDYDDAITVTPLPRSVIGPEGFEALGAADVVFGCVDLEGPRLVLTEFCAAYEKAYFDIATEVFPGSPPRYGGRVFSSVGGGCLVCMDQLDLEEAREDLESPAERAARLTAYGVPTEALARTGPSVVSINGVVASLAITEFMKWRTGLGAPTRLLRYDGASGKVTLSADKPRTDCWYCHGVRGQGARVDVERYLRQPALS